MLIISYLLAFISSASLEPNPPVWPKNVHVISPGQKNAQDIVDALYAQNGGHDPAWHGHWSDARFAILFKPGTHALTVNVGYYTSIIGLGKHPTDTRITNVVSENGDFNYRGGALSSFWRSAENFYTKPTRRVWNGKAGMQWAVSQAAPLRRVFVDGDLYLYQYNYNQPSAGYSSGGYMADCTITGVIDTGSQQQWFTRNTRMGSWSHGNWNMVFLGCENAPSSSCGEPNPYTTVDATPLIAEKPYIMLNQDTNRYYLMVPKLERNKISVTEHYSNVDQIDFENVFVATDQNTAADINAKLQEGLHVVLSPGNYHLEDSIKITKSDTYILGIGFPTLIATKAVPCIKVENVDGVRIAGVLLQAGTVGISSLLEWGSQGYSGNSDNPGFLYDCFARVGGTNNPAVQKVGVKKMVVINSGNVVGDNFWLWRADHDKYGLVFNSENPCDTGMQVNGDDVTLYGLAVEHTLKDMTEWNGENGRLYFYQSEYPYDVTQQNFGDRGYVSYKVADSVQQHQAWGVGVYSYFRDHTVIVNSGIKAPTGKCIHFTNSVSVFLTGKGQISHVINNVGNRVISGHGQEYVCGFPSENFNPLPCGAKVGSWY